MNNFFKKYSTVKINCPGGILPPGRLYQILDVLDRIGVEYLRFGLRQCIYIDLHRAQIEEFIQLMAERYIVVEEDESRPNVISAYPIEEIFPTTSWVSEGVYKDILDAIDYDPELKINLTDSAQSFTPWFTGNINWIASREHLHYWHLYIRFPRTNVLVKWHRMIYTNDLMRFTRLLEGYILLHRNRYVDQSEINIVPLKHYLNSYEWISILNDEDLPSTAFNMDYYEGLNQYGEQYWLGIYQRDEKYSLSFLRDLCAICMETRIGQICTTPWKSIIVKGIVTKDRYRWNHLLNRHLINVRHPLNELNFQVEDNNEDSLYLKKYLVSQFNEDDIRTQGICFGIKSRAKSEVFCNILIKKRHMLRLGFFNAWPVYDILISNDFNPNERTGYVFAKGLFRYLLPDQLNSCLTTYFKKRSQHFFKDEGLKTKPEIVEARNDKMEYVYQCNHCKTWMDGDALNDVMPDYTCSVCDAPGNEFKRINKKDLIESFV